MRWALSIALLACAAAACSKKQEELPPAPAASASAAPSSVTAVDRAKVDVPGKGLAAAMLRAAQDLDLRDPQRATVVTLAGTLAPGDAASLDALRDLDADLIAGARAGKIDDAKLQGRYAAMDDAAKTRAAADADILNALHAALDADQRKALVAAVREARAARPAPPRGPADWAKQETDRVSKALALDAGQRKRAAAIFESAKPRANDRAAKEDAALAAFEGDPFDAKKLDLPARSLRAVMEPQVAIVEQLLALLRPDQREKLAQMLSRPAMGRLRPALDESALMPFEIER